MSHKSFCVALLLFGSAVASAAALAQSAAERQKAYDAVLKNAFDDTLFDAYLATLPKSRNPFKPNEPFYLIEGDLPKSEAQIRAYLVAKAQEPVPATPRKPELKVQVDMGEPLFWPPNRRTLRYAVWRASFNKLNDNGTMYATTVKAMREAATDWEEICRECGIKFIHVTELDGAPAGDPGLLQYWAKLQTDELRFFVHFDVGQLLANGTPKEKGLWAEAFFPLGGLEQRNLKIAHNFVADWSGHFAAKKLTRRGVLRHEIGHILGYRHEHADPKAGADCPQELLVLPHLKDLTIYDPKSVMHYECGAGQDKGDDRFTDTDIAGHRKLYGPPP